MNDTQLLLITDLLVRVSSLEKLLIEAGVISADALNAEHLKISQSMMEKMQEVLNKPKDSE